MEKIEKEKMILDFLKNHSLGVISYVNKEGNPRSAVVEYMITDKFEILFNTFTNKRKYQDILKKPNTSFVVGWDWDENISVQYEGECEELKNIELLKYSNIYFTHLPEAKKFAEIFKNIGDLAFFRVKPGWIRYSDFNKNPWNIFEINFS